MTLQTARNLARRLRPSFHDLGCTVSVWPWGLVLDSPATGRQTFHLATNTAARVQAHASGFLAAQPYRQPRQAA